MARPRSAPDERRTVQVNMRFSPTEASQLSEKADSAGMTTAAFGRAAMLGKSIKVQKSTAPDFMTRNELRRIGVNLNQIAKAMNARHLPPPPQLVEMLHKLDTLFDQWIGDGSQNR